MENERNYFRKNIDMLFVKWMMGVPRRCYVKTWKSGANTAIPDFFCKNTSIQISVFLVIWLPTYLTEPLAKHEDTRKVRKILKASRLVKNYQNKSK